MEKMLFTTNGTGRPRRTAVETFKIDDDSIDSFQIMMLPAKYRPDFEEIVEETIAMIIKKAASSAATTRTAPVPIDKIMVQGSRGHIYLPKI
jgi:hypothetical protein